jgi:hypothetical protein
VAGAAACAIAGLVGAVEAVEDPSEARGVVLTRAAISAAAGAPLDTGFAKPIQSEVVRRASDASAPELWHHIQGLQDAVARRNNSDAIAILDRKVRLPIRVGECGDP